MQLRKIERLLARTRAQKKQIVEAVAAHPKLRTIEHNDLEGDCSTVAALRFRNEEQAREFAARLEEQEEDCMLPIDSGRHVYTNWEAIMEKRGSYHPALDAFKRPENRGTKARYEPDMCPRTLEILSRTVYLGIRPQTTAAQARKRIRAIEKAAGGVL